MSTFQMLAKKSTKPEIQNLVAHTCNKHKMLYNMATIKSEGPICNHHRRPLWTGDFEIIHHSTREETRNEDHQTQWRGRSV